MARDLLLTLVWLRTVPGVVLHQKSLFYGPQHGSAPLARICHCCPGEGRPAAAPAGPQGVPSLRFTGQGGTLGHPAFLLMTWGDEETPLKSPQCDSRSWNRSRTLPAPPALQFPLPSFDFPHPEEDNALSRCHRAGRHPLPEACPQERRLAGAPMSSVSGPRRCPLVRAGSHADAGQVVPASGGRGTAAN